MGDLMNLLVSLVVSSRIRERAGVDKVYIYVYLTECIFKDHLLIFFSIKKYKKIFY